MQRFLAKEKIERRDWRFALWGRKEKSGGESHFIKAFKVNSYQYLVFIKFVNYKKYSTYCIDIF